MATPNPFPALEEALISRTYLNPSGSYFTQLRILTGVFAIAFIGNVVAFTLRARSGGLWLYRRKTTPFGTWIVANALSCWLMYSGIFLLRTW